MLFLLASLLSGCLGGTVAQQIARSIATSVADKTVARAMDVEDEETYSDAQYASIADLSAQNNAMQRNFLQRSSPQSNLLANTGKQTPALYSTEPDPYQLAFFNAAFEDVKPISEPLPEQVAEPEAPISMVRANQLVRVEIFNLLIGAEKIAILEDARMLGALSLPPKQEWQHWQVAIGAIQHTKKVITFLIPPEFGKLPSGAVAMVELAGPGELNIARYEPTGLKYKQAATLKPAPSLKQAANTKPAVQ